MEDRHKRFLLILLLVSAGIVLLAVGLMRLATGWLASDETRATIANRFESATGGQLSFDRAGIQWRPRPSIWFDGLETVISGVIKGRCRRVAVTPSVLALLKGDLRISAVVITRPEIDLSPGILPLLAPSLPEDEHPASSAGEEFLERLVNLSFPAIDRIPRMDIRIQDGSAGFPKTPLHPLRISELNMRFSHDEEGLAVRLQSHSTHWEHQEIRLSIDAYTQKLSGGIRLTDLKPLPPMEKWARDSGIQLRHVRNSQLAATFGGEAGKEIRAEIECAIDDMRFDRPPKTQSLKTGRLSADLLLEPGAAAIRIRDLRFESPGIHVTGRLSMAQTAPQWDLSLNGEGFDVEAVRNATLFFLNGHPVAEGIFNVVRGGRLPGISFGVSGSRFADLARFRSMTLEARLDDGRIFAPGPNLDLSAVNGRVSIRDGVLEGRGLTGAFGGSTGSDGKLLLDLNTARVPFFLDLRVDADLAQLPPILIGLVDDPVFVRELESITRIDGRGRGRMVLDNRTGRMRVAVDVADFNVRARYPRVPLPIHVKTGTFHYDDRSVGLTDVSGTIGDSAFWGLSTAIGLVPPYLLTIGDGKAVIEIEELMTVLNHFQAGRTLLGPQADAGGRLTVNRVQAAGPVLSLLGEPFQLEGTIADGHLKSDRLPWEVHEWGGGILWTRDAISLSDVAFRFLDAEARLDGKFHTQGERLTSCRFQFSGHFETRSLGWLSQLASLPEAFRPDSPADIREGTISWDGDDAVSFSGRLTAPGNSRLTVEGSKTASAIDIRRLVVEDEDSAAELSIRYTDEELAATFSGTLSGESLARLTINRSVPRGMVRGTLEVLIDLSAPHRSRATGHIEGEGLTVPRGMTEGIFINKVRLDATGDTVTLSPLVVSARGAMHAVSG
ncbi:MAG: hypothetical protein PVH30_10335, partial [Desulfobacterales bacterium]